MHIEKIHENRNLDCIALQVFTFIHLLDYDHLSIGGRSDETVLADTFALRYTEEVRKECQGNDTYDTGQYPDYKAIHKINHASADSQDTEISHQNRS